MLGCPKAVFDVVLARCYGEAIHRRRARAASQCMVTRVGSRPRAVDAPVRTKGGVTSTAWALRTQRVGVLKT